MSVCDFAFCRLLACHQMGDADGFLMVGVLLLTYAIALLVGGGGALWSAVVARRHAGLRARASTLIRGGACIVLLAPLLWSLWITVRFS